jgi:signal transduction histidine kinase
MNWGRVAFFSFGLVIAGSIGVNAAEPRRILMLYSDNNQVPAQVIVGDAATRRLLEQSPDGVEIYTEYLDLGRFSGAAFEAGLARYLGDKYRDRKPEIVLAIAPPAIRFALAHRQEQSALGVPIVYCCTSSARLNALNPPADATGMIVEFDISKTFELARRLQPEARKVFVVAGAADFDRQGTQIARRQLAPYTPRYEITYLAGLPHDELMEKLTQLPSGAIVLMLSIFTDGGGRVFLPIEAATAVARAATAPVYAVYETNLGIGVVGGHMDSLKAMGIEVANTALAIMAGAKPSDLPQHASKAGLDQVDWRQLRRWNISERLLPEGTVVHFREPTLFEQYQWQVISATLALVIQALLIAGLLAERRRRRLAEVESRRTMTELAVLNRRSAIGEMSASIAHEIKQPLSAIVTNGNVVLRWLGRATPNLDEIAAAARRIVGDADRANTVIESVRTMFKKDEQRRDLTDLNDLIREVLALMHIELDENDVTVRAALSGGAVRVEVNRIQLQQVILNLIRNANEAMQEAASHPRVLRVGSALDGKGECVVSIQDSGAGIAPELLDQVFEPFFTTKSDGMGMGLAICRSIVEAHGGRLSARHASPRGTVFEIVLPLATTK